MRYLEVLELLKQKNIKIFKSNDIKNLLGISTTSAKAMITRYNKSGLFIRLKKGLYCAKDISPSQFEIANQLYKPSYISLTTALSTYNLIPEAPFSVTNVTSLYTREFEVGNIKYSYRKIKSRAFTGYIKQDGYFIATPEKAVADYLYLVSLKRMPFNDRLNLKSVNKNKVLEYARLFESKSLNDFLKKNYDRKATYSEIIN